MKPKQYYVAIDPKSVRKNPDAGMTRYIVPATIESAITITGPKCMVEREGMILTSHAVSANSKGELTQSATYQISLTPEKFKTLLKELTDRSGKDRVKFTMTNHYHTVDSLIPAREFLYDFKKKRVQCCHCKARFDHSELYSVSDDDGDNYWTDENICPKCETADACEIEYQKISDFMLAKEQIPKLVVQG